tara:strand:+ start:326 stop:964 length:639 start_codon:yes stop_codon:yes gene_type:complete
MTKIATDYSTRPVSFYKFVCNNPEIKSSYVGHTIAFNKRKGYHKQNCNTCDFKIYQMIRDNGGWDNWRMIEIESRLVKDKREAERIEQEWIEKFEADMNSHKAFGGETIEEYRKQYRIENADKIKEYLKQYYLENADAFKEYNKQVRLDNHEKIRHREKRYRLENNDKVKEKANEKVACECGFIISRSNLARHKKSPNHAELMELKSASADI